MAGNGRYARKVIIACKRERARRLHTVAPQELAALANSDPDTATGHREVALAHRELDGVARRTFRLAACHRPGAIQAWNQTAASFPPMQVTELSAALTQAIV